MKTVIKLQYISLLFCGILLVAMMSCGEDEGAPSQDDETPQSCVADAANVFEFTFDGKTYELIKENKSWAAAVSCAVERGGFLAEINSEAEQNAVFQALGTAAIDNSATVSADGGNASYVWLGANDISEEGSWSWDGDNDGVGTSFWEGDTNGTPVDGNYNNWGMEPDNAGSGQDGLAMGLTSWPFGEAGQWNDLSVTNQLYYVIEYN